MKRISVIATLVAAAFALPLAANATGTNQTTGAKSASTTNGANAGSEAFKSADTNMDGFISMEEAKGTAHAANFTALDTNADGKVSKEEHRAAKGQLAGQSGSTTGGSTLGSPTTGSSTDASVAKK